jgi:hypothetical protein
MGAWLYRGMKRRMKGGREGGREGTKNCVRERLREGWRAMDIKRTDRVRKGGTEEERGQWRGTK